ARASSTAASPISNRSWNADLARERRVCAVGLLARARGRLFGFKAPRATPLNALLPDEIFIVRASAVAGRLAALRFLQMLDQLSRKVFAVGEYPRETRREVPDIASQDNLSLCIQSLGDLLPVGEDLLACLEQSAAARIADLPAPRQLLDNGGHPFA